VPSTFNSVSRPNSPDKKPLPAPSSAALNECTGQTTSAHVQEPSLKANGTERATTEFFHTLDDLACPRSALWAGAGLHVALLIVLLLAPLSFTESIKVNYKVLLLTPPAARKQPLEVTTWTGLRPKPAPTVPVASPPTQPRVLDEIPRPDAVQPKIDKINAVDLAMPAPPQPAVEPLPVAAPTPKPAVHTGSFSSVTAAEPAGKLQPRGVQTGGFGDPSGVAAKAANIAPLGSFDLQAGAGAGNGSGAARGERTIVVSSGFGSARAAGASNGVAAVNQAGELKLRQSGFGDVQAVSMPLTAKKADSGVPDTPAAITFKPKPEYTDDARKLRVEGEVLLRVLFGATGEVRVLEVVRGLGHGLDENAISAAQQIRFKPALRSGHPVDSTVTVHILFQLAF
jgi:TonB family protein